MEEIIKQIAEKKAIPIGADICPGCQQDVPVKGCAFIPLNHTIEKDGITYEHLAVFICSSCSADLDPNRILLSLRRMFMEFDVSVF